jgi:thiol-disulfide isomerase/thioredoxin
MAVVSQPSVFGTLLGDTLVTKTGVQHTSSILKSKRFVALYFSASWCPPCRGKQAYIHACIHTYIHVVMGLALVVALHYQRLLQQCRLMIPYPLNYDALYIIAFTPVLREFYEECNVDNSDEIEIVFVSSDKNMVRT